MSRAFERSRMAAPRYGSISATGNPVTVVTCLFEDLSRSCSISETPHSDRCHSVARRPTYGRELFQHSRGGYRMRLSYVLGFFLALSLPAAAADADQNLKQAIGKSVSA